MAITQQLARLDEGLIEQCKHDVRRLDELCSFRLLEPDDHLDLDWSPAILQVAARIAQLSSERLSSLALATGGGSELNPAYRDFPDSILEHPVTFNAADQVITVHSTLQGMAEDGSPSDTTARTAVAQLGGGVSPTDAHTYLSTHFGALNDFYSIAAARGLAVPMWWD